MRKILISVEGQTEEEFVKSILGKYLRQKHTIYVEPVILKTKRVGNQTHRGGLSKYSKVKKDIQNLLKDSNATLITTMYDVYQLPSDFPEYNTMPQGTPQQQVVHLTEAFEADINNPRFKAYFSLHEFEALLFSDPEKIVEAFPDQQNKLSGLQKIIRNFETPEDINHDQPPAKRLEGLFTEYKKTIHGYYISDEIGIKTMLQHCPHFAAWVRFLTTHSSIE